MPSAELPISENSVPSLRITDLTKRYGEECAVDRVTFSTSSGEVVGIIGPNGAGKTTLLEAVVGLLPADSGEVLWHGQVLPASQRRNALFYLPDGVRPYRDEATFQVVSFFAGIYRRSKAETADTIDSVGLSPVLHKRVHALSKGYNRRLLLALALLAPHPVLLMDEPFDGFDLRQTREIVEVLRNQAARGRTFILAIHQLADAERVCDRVILIAAGRVRGAGTLDELRAQTAPLWPLLAKELREITSGRALWTMLLLLCPLIGYSFFQAVSLYNEASTAALQSPVLANSLSPLDGILVPTLGSFYVAVTLLFPFVAIRALGQEKETGALRLLVQLPYRPSTLVLAKLAAVLAAWGLASIPALSALTLWRILGGHLAPAETANLLFGHLAYGLLVGALALFSASISDSAATAAIVALAITIGSWVLDFTVAGNPGLLSWIAQLSLTQTLRPFEQGLLSGGLVLGTASVIFGLIALATVWLPPGVPSLSKVRSSLPWVLAVAVMLGGAAQLRLTVDVTEDRRNSFPGPDQKLLATLRLPLLVTVHLAPEDPRYADLQRNVLAKLGRAAPNVSVTLAGLRRGFSSGSSDESYGEVEYAYGGRSDASRSTSPREILPLLYALAGVSPPVPAAGGEYPGYPLVASVDGTLFWFFGGLPLLIVLCWWWIRRPPSADSSLVHQGGPS